MVNAYSLISAEPGKTAEVLRKIKAVEGIKKADLIRP